MLKKRKGKLKRKVWYTRFCRKLKNGKVCNKKYRTIWRRSRCCADCDKSPPFKYISNHMKSKGLEPPKVMLGDD